MSYIVLKNKNVYDINYMEYDLDGMVMHPKLKGSAYIHVSEARFYDQDIIKNICLTKLKKQFGSLVKIVFNYLTQDDETADGGDYIILLDEVAHLKAQLEIKYKRFLDNEMYREYMDKLYFLDINLKNKLARVNLYSQISEQLGGKFTR